MAIPSVSSVIANTTSSIGTSSRVTSSVLSVLSTSVGDVFKSAVSYVIPENYAKGVGLAVSVVVILSSSYMAYRDRQEAKRLLADEEVETKEGNKYNFRSAGWALLALKEGINVAASLYFPQSTQLVAELPLAVAHAANNLSKPLNESIASAVVTTVQNVSENLSQVVNTTSPFVGTAENVSKLLQCNFSEAALESSLLADLPQIAEEIPYPSEIFDRIYNVSSLIRPQKIFTPVIKDITDSRAWSNVSTYLQSMLPSFPPLAVKPAEAPSSSVISSLWNKLFG